MTLRTLIFRYTVFAIIATAANLAAQRVVMEHDKTAPYFVLAVSAGTIAGLVIKYLLDKRWIFHDMERGARRQSRQFSLYAATGTATTAIFWSSETAFWVIWHTSAMREIGAISGLIMGYILKYNLDRRFVFTCSPSERPR